MEEQVDIPITGVRAKGCCWLLALGNVGDNDDELTRLKTRRIAYGHVNQPPNKNKVWFLRYLYYIPYILHTNTYSYCTTN